MKSCPGYISETSRCRKLILSRVVGTFVRVCVGAQRHGVTLIWPWPIMPCPGYISETIRCRSWYLVGTLVGGYRCATSWYDLDLTFHLAYLMLFYLSTGICDTLLSLLYLSYLFTWILVVAPLGVFWCRLSTVKVKLKFIKGFTFATSHCNRWYCIKWVTGFAPTPHISMYCHICMYG